MEHSPLPPLQLCDQDYFALPGLNVLLGQDYYPDGHQSGLVILQHGKRVASNGDLRLETAGGQWQPIPRQVTRTVSEASQTITVTMAYPDASRNRTGFNPIEYPDLSFSYRVLVTAEGRRFRVGLELETPLPSPWDKKVRFCLELFPGALFGRSFCSPGGTGSFPRQPNGPFAPDSQGERHLSPLAKGAWLVVAPETPCQRLRIEAVTGGELTLVDGRERHNNGWFVVQAELATGKAGRVLEWLVDVSADPSFRAPATVQINQVGYKPQGEKRVVVELDPLDLPLQPVRVERVLPSGERQVVAQGGQSWGMFLRSRYLTFDFSAVNEPGTYLAAYGDTEAGPFQIGDEVYARHVWQPTLEYFLPVQMCHMRVDDGYRVWHGACHRSDALMAPPGLQHFDGYRQGPTTLCAAKGGEKLRGLNEGGWHDAGDFDLRLESQAETVRGLALARELFGAELDSTTVDWAHHVVTLRRPDGTPDILEQIEHGLKSLLGGWKALGRPYRGIIEASLQDYVLLGDPVNHEQPRLVFTEEQPHHEALMGAALAAASRVMVHRPALARECLDVAWRLWERLATAEAQAKLVLAVELLQCEGPSARGLLLAKFLSEQKSLVSTSFDQVGWLMVRVLDQVEQAGFEFRRWVTEAARLHRDTLARSADTTPYGIPYRPNIWGAGWQIQNFGMQQVFLHLALPELFDSRSVYRALDFILGCHPGANNASFVSGVGAKSVTTAYGLNRADAGCIPGGAVSGTALIRPDFPELLDWPYLWQQTEYVLGAGTTDWLLLALAADKLGR